VLESAPGSFDRVSADKEIFVRKLRGVEPRPFQRQHDLDQMAACLKGARTTGDWREWQQLDEKLHRTIAEASRNSVLIELYNAINRPEHKDLWGHLRGPLPNEQREEYMSHHEGVVEAIRNRDPDAAEQAIRKHLERVKQLLLNYA
jgi:DNA-binding FadR family transcriptional regulator